VSTVPAQAERRFTYADYLTWPNHERWELIDGVAYAMTPAPGSRHQAIALELGRQLANWLLDKPCRALIAPLDVRLPEQSETDEQIVNVIEPDVIVVCDRKKIDRRGVRGAPDLVIEIISPGTSSRDEIKKANLYERHRVREYWVVYPSERLVHLRVLGPDGMFSSRYVEAKGRIPVSILEDFEFDFDSVFQQIGNLELEDE
jgi:Uma2 family endonuclease